MKLPEFIVTTATIDYFIFYDKEEPYINFGDRPAMLYDVPTVDVLFKKLRDKDFLSTAYRGRNFFLYILKDRPDLTETHRRLIKMHNIHEIKRNSSRQYINRPSAATRTQ
jgi:hypothetical protein